MIMQRIEKITRFSFMFCHHLHTECFTTRARKPRARGGEKNCELHFALQVCGVLVKENALLRQALCTVDLAEETRV